MPFSKSNKKLAGKDQNLVVIIFAEVREICLEAS